MPLSAQTDIGDALSAATDALAAAGVESPRLDAELLYCAASGLDRARLATEPDIEVEPAAGREFAAMVRRRVRREPVAYILGSKGFRHITLACDRRALIPRPETELLVEIAVELGPSTILDVGTGTGAVALAIGDELPGAVISATDTSESALELARENATHLGLADRVRFASGVLPSGSEPGFAFELVVANLPYVRDREWGSLAPEISQYEPREAVLGGPDGLDPIRSLLDAISPDPPAAIALEVGVGQAREVRALVRAAGFAKLETRRDLAGIDRVVMGRR